MLQLSTDSSFHFEILRVLSGAPYQGSDIGEVLVAANKIVPGDFESYYNAFYDLASRVHNTSQAIDSKKYPVSARNALFREATYYRSADFYLHGNKSDPRINSLWDQQLASFNAAIALLPVPGQRITIPADSFEIPAIFYGTGLPGRRPTILMCSGFDGSQEEMYHQVGEAVVQRGMNVITFEGPGQPTVRRQQNLGFIPEWEKVVTPVVDWAVAARREEVDPARIGLWGSSFGGYLAPRAAAFEHRVAAVVAFDGIYSFAAGIDKQFGPDAVALFRSGNQTAFNLAIEAALVSPKASTGTKWGIAQGMWSFDADTPYEWFSRTQQYTLEGVVQNISAPVYVGDAQHDQFFPGQAVALAQALGDRATYRNFLSADGAGEHCSLGASVLSNQVVLDWFEDVVGWTR